MATLLPPLEDSLVPYKGIFVPRNVVESLPLDIQKAVGSDEDTIRAREAAFRGKFFHDWRAAAASTTIPGVLSKPLNTPNFRLLRALREGAPLLRQIISKRQQQIKAFGQPASANPRGIGYRVVHDLEYSEHFNVTHEIKLKCAAIERIIQNTTLEIHKSFRDYLVSAAEEELVIDRKCIVRYRNAKNQVYQYHLVPGDSIRPILPFLLPYAAAWGLDDWTETAERLSYEMYIGSDKSIDIDFTKVAYVQIVDEKICGAWTPDQLDVDVTNTTVELSKWGYGESLLQRAIEWVDTFVEFWKFTTALGDVRYPEAILALEGDYDPIGLQSFKDQLSGETGPGNQYRLPVIPNVNKDNKMELIKLRETPKDMMFVDLLNFTVELACGAFQMDPIEIGWIAPSGGSTGDNAALIQNVSGAAKEASLTMSKESGLRALLDDIARQLTFAIVKTIDPNLQLVFVGLDDEDEKAKIDRVVAKVASVSTINEGRKELGAEEWKAPEKIEDLDLANTPLNATPLQFLQAKAMAAQQASATASYGQGDFTSGDDAGGGPPLDKAPNENVAPGAPPPAAGEDDTPASGGSERPSSPVGKPGATAALAPGSPGGTEAPSPKGVPYVNR